MKYQFCIRFDKIDPNSAASKAVTDCNEIFSKNGYKDHTITVGDNSNRAAYYYHLFKELNRFFFSVKKNAVVGIQYPLLSINHVFKYFINIVKFKGGKFFCIIHDLESLRKGGNNRLLIEKEVANLNCYDYIIAHNNLMIIWLKEAGVVKPIISLELFDYLTHNSQNINDSTVDQPIVYAGNLAKSTFIYQLPQIINHRFNLYGPGFNTSKVPVKANFEWKGEYSPLQVVKELKGSFGLIWDGDNIDYCDEILGNYLKFNNPHKFSLYIAAGLPVIAPADSAIGIFIKKFNIGVLINNLHDLNDLGIQQQEYEIMKRNVLAIREKVINGQYFEMALQSVEKNLC